MSDDEPHPLSWMALPERHPVLSADGEAVGYGASALGDLRNGRFDGIVVGIEARGRDSRLMLEVAQIDELLSDGIHTNLTADEIRALPPFQRDRVWKPSRKGLLGRILDRLGGDGSSMWDRR
jgi:hypothetical protein